MRYFKTFEVFDIKNDANFAKPNWSIANSFTGNFFTQVFRKMIYAKREVNLSSIASSIDKVLTREYNLYLKSREKQEDTEENIENIQDNDIITTTSQSNILDLGVLKSVKDVEMNPSSISNALTTLDNMHIFDTEYAEETIDVDFIDVTNYNQNNSDIPLLPRSADKPKLIGTDSEGAHQQAYLLGNPKLVAHATGSRSKRLAAITALVEHATDLKTVRKIYNQLVKEEANLKLKLSQVERDIADSGGDPSDPAFMQLLVDYKALELDLEHCLSLYVVIKALLVKYAMKPLDESVTSERSSGIKPKDWTEEDKKNLTSKLNMYELDEYYIKAKYFLNDGVVRERDKVRLQRKWELLENSIYKKWNWVYLIDAIKSKHNIEQVEKKKAPGVKLKAALAGKYTGKVEPMTTAFAPTKQVPLSKPYFFLNTGDTHTFLVKKCTFFKDRMLFRIIGEVGASVNNADKLVIAQNYQQVDSISNNKQTLLFDNENKASFPVIMISEKYLYATMIKNGVINSIMYDGLGLTHITDNKIAEEIALNTKGVPLDIKKVSVDINSELLGKLEKIKIK